MEALDARDAIYDEYHEAAALHGGIASAHEGIAVIEEEFLELREEVFKNGRTRSLAKMRKEAIQLGAMALKFLVHVDSRGCVD